MEIPYGFDCYAFQKEEIKFFEPNLYQVKRSLVPSLNRLGNGTQMAPRPAAAASTFGQTDFIKFTRKNEDYPREQIEALGRANRLNMSEIDKRLFCGIKIQIGIGVVTNFLRKGLQYKPPIRGRSELVNGSWTGVMRGLTIENEAPASYDLALGNFLAWDEEFPYIKFGPFFAVESKLVFLTGGSRRIEASSFGTNVTREIWITILSLLFILSLLSSSRVYSAWHSRGGPHRLHHQHQHHHQSEQESAPRVDELEQEELAEERGIMLLFQDFLFIYITMLLNKPSVEFDDLVWPKKHHGQGRQLEARQSHQHESRRVTNRARAPGASGAAEGRAERANDRPAALLPTSIRALSYMWSAACLVIASIYSGEMLAVMLLHADQNIDTIAQLIDSRPPIRPVIRQDDMTHNMMLKSLDQNMLRLHNLTQVIPRADVYTRPFIESVSERKVALLGDDELIDTVYDLYHKYYPLYKSKVTYLQYPISMIYRKDLNTTLELQLRRGMVQMFEMGLIHRWYQAQKDTYIRFYDTYERNKTSAMGAATTSVASNSEQNYRPLSMHHFGSFFLAMLYCKLAAICVLLIEICHHRLRK